MRRLVLLLLFHCALFFCSANLVTDASPGKMRFVGGLRLLHNISWSNAQKLRLITSAGDNMTYEFRYNPMQQRVAKLHRYFNNEGIGETRTYYIRDAQGNVMATYRGWGQYYEEDSVTWDSFALAEQHIYGSSRVGIALPEVKLYPTAPPNPHASDSIHYEIYEGWKRYEITNHLGNVLAVITDRKRGRASSGTNIQWFVADVLATQQYYPFGMLMPGDTSVAKRRQYSLNSYDYRYGFNGKEGDDEVKGDDNQQDYGMRIYDPRVARFLSVDPIAREYPWYTPYQFAGNMPIAAIDLDGLEPFWIVGTNQKPQDVTTETNKTAEYLLRNVATLAHDPNIPIDYGFDWSKNNGLYNETDNEVSDRSSAAQVLADYVVNKHVKGQPITLIGYSHGGNVGAQAAPLISESLGLEVNLITLNTPASNLVINAWTDPNGLGNRSQNPRWAENPDNPKIQSAILDWYHFYIPGDYVAGIASGGYELSDLKYDEIGGSDFVRNFKIDINAKKGVIPYSERQRDPTYNGTIKN